MNGTDIYEPELLLDGYKLSHRVQYPAGTEFVYSTWIPRGSRIPGVDNVVAFGFQAFVQKWLVEYWNENFFRRDKEIVLDEYRRIIGNYLGDPNPEVEHLAALHDLGYLPLDIRAVPEGTLVPLRVPMLTIENTHPDFYWLTNYIETLISAEIWLPSTSATIAFEYRKLFEKHAKLTGSDPGGIPFQGHDFSMRGMSSIDSAAKSGGAHLLSFTGTDTVPAIQWLERYYFARLSADLIGASIPATEHSVMCAYGETDEFETFRHLIQDVYPDGFVSIVSDTWDLWTVITKYLPELKDEVLARNGRVVIRPDSGDPVDIIAGTYPLLEQDSTLGDFSPEEKGVIECLWDIFGGTVNEAGYKVLDPHIGAIYGDSITLDRAKQILERLAFKGFASGNIVFGIGSFTYQYQTRDTFDFALKSTWAQVNGEERFLFKDPKTDTNHMKRSLKGRVTVVDEGPPFGIGVVEGLTLEESTKEHYYPDLLQPIFYNGEVQNLQTLRAVREKLLANLEEE